MGSSEQHGGANDQNPAERWRCSIQHEPSTQEKEKSSDDLKLAPARGLLRVTHGDLQERAKRGRLAVRR